MLQTDISERGKYQFAMLAKSLDLDEAKLLRTLVRDLFDKHGIRVDVTPPPMKPQ